MEDRPETNESAPKPTKKKKPPEKFLQFSVRVPPDFASRFDALARALKNEPEARAWRAQPSRASVVRLALFVGMDELEKKFSYKMRRHRR